MDPVKDFTDLKVEVDVCLDKLQQALDGLVEGSLDESTQTDAQIQRFWRQYFALRDRQNGNLQVAVLALAKSGEQGISGRLLSARPGLNTLIMVCATPTRSWSLFQRSIVVHCHCHIPLHLKAFLA